MYFQLKTEKTNLCSLSYDYDRQSVAWFILLYSQEQWKCDS